jgi:hypothetical protein
VSVALRVGDHARITLPAQTPGVFVWNGQTHDLPAGETTRLPMPE